LAPVGDRRARIADFDSAPIVANRVADVKILERSVTPLADGRSRRYASHWRRAEIMNMPIHLGGMSRRAFCAAGAAVWASGVETHASEETSCFAYLADTHIAADPRAMRGSTTMADNLARVVKEIVALERRPNAAFLHGDCAFLDGQKGDYTTLGELSEPLVRKGVPLHFMLGNHDHRDRFLDGVKSGLPSARPVASKHVAVLETPLANFVMLDTLELVNKTPGKLGDAQLKWLAKVLDDRPNKPAVVNLHHNPVFAQVLEIAGLKDTADLWKVLAPRKQVKAVFFGHTHHWNRTEKDGVHCINLPPVAYVFQNADPNGWVEFTPKSAGATLRLHALDKSHKLHGEKVELSWRK
jgi:3',5'-cyclic AMP phosphodiesterase CpdA